MRNWRRWISLAIAAVTSIGWCAAALARAGGGHGYSGGGGGHGGGGGFHGGGGGGGDGGDLIQLLFWLLFSHPGVGFPVLILVVVFFIIASKQGNGVYQSSVIRRGNAIMDRDARMQMINAMTQRDPAFTLNGFLDRVAVAFKKTQDAWSAQQIEMARAFLSDGVFERFNLQVDEQKSKGIRNLMQNVAVQDNQIAQIFSDEHFDEISVRIQASADDTDVSLETGKTLRTNLNGSFVEIWSFIRRRGALTKPGQPGLIEGHCPNCGAPIEMNQNANCASCKALLRSGEFDWVLSEITQECEWQLREEKNLPGVSEMRQRDPGFNEQEIEDRASVMFWRRATAERLGDVRPLRSVASKEYCDNYEQQLRAQMGGGRTWFGDCAVGSVDTLGVIPGADVDRVLVEVRWSGQRYVIKNGKAEESGPNALQRTAYVLARKPGVKTDIGQAISSAHCPQCGAPNMTVGVSGACEFCGAILNDGSMGWVLWDTQSPAEAYSMLNQSSPPPIPGADGFVSGPPAPAGLLAWMVVTAMADGTISREEMEMLIQASQWYKVPRERIDEMIRAGLQNQLHAPEPSSPAEAKLWLAQMTRMALADGQLSSREQELLRSTGARLGMVDYDMQALLRDVRGQMYQEAKQALRSSNGGHP